jgi:hypothetical protein
MITPRRLLRLEGLVVAGAGIGAFVLRDGSLLFFVAVVLLPDLSMLGYLVSPRVGALAYNAVHTYAGPAALLVAGLATGESLAVDAGVVWAAHVGVDRLFGLGLKYGDADFSDTHLQRV